MTVDVLLLHTDDCPNWQRTQRYLDRLAADLDIHVRTRHIDTPQEARRLGMAGSPTVLVDGTDPFPADDVDWPACRIYDTPAGPSGSPSLGQLWDALTGALTGTGSET